MSTNQEQPTTINELVQAYKANALNPYTFLQQKLDQVKQDKYNAWISIISDERLKAYIDKLAGQDIDKLPLYGVPFAIKDNIDLAGLPTTAGCKEYSYSPESSAFVVEQLIAAGAIPLGKTNLDQFATGLVGTRSPWGEVKNSFDPEYVSGGSSSGSAVSVANGQVFFSLGTDTAGSGRVPAAFNNLYGLKATKGLLSCSGVVPACKSLDCVTLFAPSAEDISLLYSVAAVYDQQDCYSRIRSDDGCIPTTSFHGTRIGIPHKHQLEFFGDDQYQKLFQQSLERMQDLGAELVPFDLDPFIEAAKLLYQGPWVAERYAAIQSFFDQQPSSCLPVIEQIVGGAKSYSAADTFKAMYQLQSFKVKCDKLLSSVDVVLTPTTGTTYKIDQVNADPIQLNSNLGYYTNFMNLLDYSAIAMPAGFTQFAMPFGVTLFSAAFADIKLMALAECWQRENALPLATTKSSYTKAETVDLLVCGAHMTGLPLNSQLTAIGGVLKAQTTTSANYKMYKLAGDAPFRPGMIRDEKEGREIEVEIWQLPLSGIGRLLSQIPHPLGLGSIELKNGDWVKGFICEPIGIDGATDISHFGGWRAFLSNAG